MKNKIGIYIFLFALPAFTTIGYYIFHNRENKYMIEIDAAAIIVALLAAVTALFGIIIVEIVGWRKTLDKMNRYEDMIGVDKNRVCLSKQHEDMKEEIFGLKKEISKLIAQMEKNEHM